nr:hypothetical protein [Tanacetum cinerariifolium]
MKRIIKGQVKSQVKDQVSRILPRIEQSVNAQLEYEVLTRSSHSSRTSYAVDADLSEMELKKILIEKMEGNKSIQRSDEQRNLYKALVEAYEADKIILDSYGERVILKQRRDDDDDQGERPSTGSDRGSKRQREKKESESARASLEPTTRSAGAEDQPIVQTSQHPEWFPLPKKPPTPDRDWNKTLQAVQGSAQTWISELAKQANSRSSFNELLDTSIDISNFIMNRLGVYTLTLKLLAGPTYELMRGSCNSLTELEYHLEEPLPLIPDNRGRRVIPFAHFINNDLEYLRGGALSRKYTTSVTKTKAADYGHIKWIEYLVPRTMWIQEPINYDKHALWGVSHWGRKQEEAYELYRDVDINQGRRLQLSADIEESHVTLTSINPDGQQESSSVSSQFVSSMLNPTSDAVFRFEDRPKSLEINFSEFIQTNQFAKAVSNIPGIVHQYMNQQMTEVVREAVQIQTDRLRDSYQRENDEFLRTIDDNMKRIIKEQALVDAYEEDKTILDSYGETAILKRRREDDDDQEGPSTGSDRGSAGKSTKGSKSRQASASESAFAEEPVQTISQIKESSHPVFETEEVYKATTYQLDWVNLEGQQYPHNLLQPLPLILDNQGRRVIPFAHFINNDLEYLRGGFIYQNKDKKNRLMRIDELHKFIDRMLNDVRNALDDRLKGIRMQYLPQTIWRKGDKDRAAAMIQAIDKMLKTGRIMRSLEGLLEDDCMRVTSRCCKGPYDSSYAASIFTEVYLIQLIL